MSDKVFVDLEGTSLISEHTSIYKDVCGTCGCPFTYKLPFWVSLNHVRVKDGVIPACGSCAVVARHITFCLTFKFPVDLSVPGSDLHVFKQIV